MLCVNKSEPYTFVLETFFKEIKRWRSLSYLCMRRCCSTRLRRQDWARRRPRRPRVGYGLDTSAASVSDFEPWFWFVVSILECFGGGDLKRRVVFTKVGAGIEDGWFEGMGKSQERAGKDSLRREIHEVITKKAGENFGEKFNLSHFSPSLAWQSKKQSYTEKV